MKDAPKLLKSNQRQVEFLAKAVEAQEEQAKKKAKTESDVNADGPGPSSKKNLEDEGMDVESATKMTKLEITKNDMDINGLEINDDLEEVADFIRYLDEKTGEVLDPKLVEIARQEEVAFMNKIVVFEESSREECWEETGKAPVSTKWVDLNKGSKTAPEVRCRLVARDFKPKGERDREDLFAAMPPPEAKKTLFSKAVANDEPCRRGGDERLKLMFVDVRKAHLNGHLEDHENAFVAFPAERGERGRCVRLKRWLYGMRPAAAAWEADYAAKLRDIGFMQGRAAPTVFFNAEL